MDFRITQNSAITGAFGAVILLGAILYTDELVETYACRPLGSSHLYYLYDRL